ncbi:hypothetical protein KIPB_007192 [Kipferlia bialata]|uniref:Uncharacterized protein n=1 Tax=Kipferlia bialata TaxID=797122 RepID=A0A391P3N3_9EUKA|nr:hypothetical protein KIPB_007192 [Kipferlia bialata]|eukprot:g7192.t1
MALAQVLPNLPNITEVLILCPIAEGKGRDMLEQWDNGRDKILDLRSREDTQYDEDGDWDEGTDRDTDTDEWYEGYDDNIVSPYDDPSYEYYQEGYTHGD